MALAAMIGGGASPVPASQAGAPTAPAPPKKPAQPSDFSALVDAIEGKGKQMLGIQLRDHVGLVSFEPGKLVLKPLRPMGPDFTRELAAAAKDATGAHWEIRLTDEGGAPSLQQQEVMAEEKMRAAVLEEPGVKDLMAAFPDATLEEIEQKEA